MRKHLVYCAFFLFVFSCSGKDEVPSEIIQPETMKSILWDVMSAQSYALVLQRRDSGFNVIPETKALTQKVFTIHQITASDFNKSYHWYMAHPGVLTLILDSLYTQKQRANMLEMERRNLPDSLKRKIP